MKRIFIGLKIPRKLQTEIARWRKKYSTLPVRWISGKNLHITLIPPFYEKNLRAVKEKIKMAENYSGQIGVVFDRITLGPDPKKPRLIWACGKTPKELGNIKKYFEKILKRPAEKRPFSLHLTLAKFRPEDFRRFPVKKMDEIIFWKNEIKSIILFESKLSPKGAAYKVLEEIKLRK